jgi:hypothetical protein
MPNASVSSVVKGFKSSEIENEKSPPWKTLESNPYLTISTAPFLALTDSKSHKISSEKPKIAVHEAATLVASDTTNYPGINTLTYEPLAITIPLGVDPIIVKFVYSCPVSRSSSSTSTVTYAEGTALKVNSLPL